MRRLIVMIAIVAGFTATPTIAQPVSDEAAIRATLSRWMADFNAGRADKVCDIFASVLRADVKGAGERDFDAQCKVLHGALADVKCLSCGSLEDRDALKYALAATLVKSSTPEICGIRWSDITMCTSSSSMIR